MGGSGRGSDCHGNRWEDGAYLRKPHLRPTPGSFSLVVDILRVGIGEGLTQMPSEMLVHEVAAMAEDTMIKFLAKTGKEDGGITYLLVAITGRSRWLLNRGNTPS